MEAGDPTDWTKPDDFLFNPKESLPKMANINGEFKAALSNGLVRFFPATLEEKILKLLIQGNDGKVIPNLP